MGHSELLLLDNNTPFILLSISLAGMGFILNLLQTLEERTRQALKKLELPEYVINLLTKTTTTKSLRWTLYLLSFIFFSCLFRAFKCHAWKSWLIWGYIDHLVFIAFLIVGGLVYRAFIRMETDRKEQLYSLFPDGLQSSVPQVQKIRPQENDTEAQPKP